MKTPIAYQAENFQIGLYQPDQFITAFNWTNEQDENVTPVLRSRFQTPEGQVIDGFAKPFCAQDPWQAMCTVNEVTGWLLAKNYGLPCAERAFFIPIARNELPPFHKGYLPESNNNGLVMCFVTQAISNTAVRGIYNTDELIREQASWQHSDDTIAFDEAIANPDRHAFNLLRKGENDFYLIDHGFLGFDEKRAPVHELPDSDSLAELIFANRLHINSYIILDRNNPAVTVQGYKNGMNFSQTMSTSFGRAVFELAFWCSQLIPGKSAKWLNFLYNRSRSDIMSNLLHKRFGVLPI